MTYEREIAGVFAGAGALFLIWQEQYVAAVAILSSMVGFFVGERNGARKASG